MSPNCQEMYTFAALQQEIIRHYQQEYVCVSKSVIIDKAIHFTIRKIRGEKRVVSLGRCEIKRLFILSR